METETKTEEEYPTPNQLLKKIGYVNEEGNVLYISVAYGNSRTILNHLDTPVVAYGLGYGGFICVIRHLRGVLAYEFGMKRPCSKWKEGGFTVLSIEEALKTIGNNPLLVEVKVDEKKCKDTVKKFERPVVATFDYNYKYNSYDKNTQTTKYRIVRLKNGKLRGEEYNTWGERWGLANLQQVLRIYSWRKKEAKPKEKDWDWREWRTFDNINFPQEILEEAKQQLFDESL